jgi:hypothetical protein
VPIAGSPRQTMYTRMTLTAQTTTSGGALGLVDRFAANGASGVHCGGARASLNVGLLALVNAANGNFIDQVSHPFTVGTVYDLKFQRTDSTFECSELAGSKTVREQTGAGNGTHVGFRTRIASAKYDYFMLVRSSDAGR